MVWRLYFRPDQQSPVFLDLKGLFEKTAGLIPVLAQMLEQILAKGFDSHSCMDPWRARVRNLRATSICWSLEVSGWLILCLCSEARSGLWDVL